jgi:predicted dinucleotide-binding enzyme
VPVDKLEGKVVEGFNHLDAGILGQSSDVKGGRRVVFLASDDEAAATEVGALVEELGFASINLGGVSKGRLLVQARGTNGDF